MKIESCKVLMILLYCTHKHKPSTLSFKGDWNAGIHREQHKQIC